MRKASLFGTPPAPTKRQKGRTVRVNVLERFLVDRLGKLWDKVFAEACEPRNTLRRFTSNAGSMADSPVLRLRRPPPKSSGLYVHPKTSLLARTRTGLPYRWQNIASPLSAPRMLTVGRPCGS